jgi:hypothetical protein
MVLLDTNLRFYSGVWVGLGLALWWLIPTIRNCRCAALHLVAVSGGEVRN